MRKLDKGFGDYVYELYSGIKKEGISDESRELFRESILSLDYGNLNYINDDAKIYHTAMRLYFPIYAEWRGFIKQCMKSAIITGTKRTVKIEDADDVSKSLYGGKTLYMLNTTEYNGTFLEKLLKKMGENAADGSSLLFIYANDAYLESMSENTFFHRMNITLPCIFTGKAINELLEKYGLYLFEKQNSREMDGIVFANAVSKKS